MTTSNIQGIRMNNKNCLVAVSIVVFISPLIAHNIIAASSQPNSRSKYQFMHKHKAPNSIETVHDINNIEQESEISEQGCREEEPKPNLTVTFFVSVGAAAVLLVSIAGTVYALEYIFNARTFRINVPPARHRAKHSVPFH